jgi:hypothetical protein
MIIKPTEDEMGRACKTHEREENAYEILVGKLRKCRNTRKDSIKTSLKKIRWEVMEWNYPVQ